MKKLLPFVFAFLFVSMASAQVNITPSMTPSQIQSAINGATPGNTVSFAAGSYPAASFTLPCTGGTIYTGPVVGQAVTSYTAGGVQSFSNLPTAVMSSASNTSYSFSINSNGSGNTSYTAGCTIQYFDFSGTQGGIFVNYPASGITIQNNLFENNNPAPGGGQSGIPSNIFLDGNVGTFNAANGVSYIHIVWNIARNNCAQIQNNVFPDNGGFCALAFTNAWHTNELIENNTINGTEQGLKWAERNASGVFFMNNDTIQNNNFQGFTRIASESQQASNGGATGALWQHNAFYQPTNPNFGTFGFSATLGGSNTGAAGTINDNAIIAVVPVTIGGSGGHYAYAVEMWGNGFTTQYNLIQGGNTATGCAGGEPCTGWAIVVGPPSNSMTINNNLCTGYYCNLAGLMSTEDGGSLTAPGQVLTPNTIRATSTTITSATPNISPASGTFSGSQTVTLSSSDGNRAYTIFYTTDGSTPCTFGPGGSCGSTQVYTAPFNVTTTTTVKAIEQWGQGANQGIVFPNFGYVPSPVASATYTANSGLYISPTGNDSNPGTLAQPWLTPNHALTCGTTITALSGTYNSGNFQSGHWGTVTCAGGNNVVWLTCQTFDTCKISSTSSDAMWVDKSYWGVQGWEATTSVTASGACFHAGPSSGSTIHHIIFANNVANGCMGGGFTAYNQFGSSTTASVDYITYLGNIAYNTAQGTGACYSGLNIYQPIASDNAAGTHMYIAGNFAYNVVDASPCSGGQTTDGEGINFDTFDFSQGGGTAYTQQAVAYNNISVSNGGRGVYAENNGFAHSTAGAPIIFKQNTAYGNNKQASQSFCVGNGDLAIQANNNGTVTNNIGMTDTANGCTGVAKWAAEMANCNLGTNNFSGNWLYSATGNTTFLNNCTSSYGSNTTGISPAFSNPTVPGPPACSGTTNVPNCMAGLIANFKPTAAGSASLGYQTPSTTSVTDPLYPQWLCNVTLPPGLVTPGCGGSPPPPALTSCQQTNAGLINTINVGQTVQQIAQCYYASVPVTTNCSITDTYGNAATSWGTSDATKLTVGQVGSGNTCNGTTQGAGCVKGIAAGTANSTLQVTGGRTCSPWTFTINNAAPTLNGVTITIQGGGTTVAVGDQLQACANMAYINPTANTTVCGAGTDAYGTSPSNYTSSSTANATMGISSGVLTGVAQGTTNISVTAGAFHANPLAITINPAGPPSNTIQGPTGLQGTVVIQ